MELGENDAGAETLRDYLITLLLEVWKDNEFTAKRPFGNSGWRYDIYKPMIQRGIVEGKLDEWGYIESLDETRAEGLVVGAIYALGWGHPPAEPIVLAQAAWADSDLDI